jgi:single-strand DNA-binding protein
MLNLNRATVIGRLTRDPELRTIPSGQSVCDFSVATNRRWTNREGEQQDEVEFHNVVVWGKLAEIASQVLGKGRLAYVEGRLQTRSWEAQDGNQRQRTEIVADNLISLERGSGGKSGPTSTEIDQSSAGEEIDQRPAGEKTEKKESGKTNQSPQSDQSEEIDIDDIPL